MIYTHVLNRGGRGVVSPADRLWMVALQLMCCPAGRGGSSQLDFAAPSQFARGRSAA